MIYVHVMLVFCRSAAEGGVPVVGTAEPAFNKNYVPCVQVVLVFGGSCIR